MKISKDSWHFKYISKRWVNRPPSLCWYFWKVVISMFIITGLSFFALFFAFVAVLVLFGPMFGWMDAYLVPVGASIAFWIIIGAVVSGKYRIYLYDTHQLKRPIVKTKPHKEPGIVSQYLHAKHRKICPLLQYERGRHEN